MKPENCYEHIYTFPSFEGCEYKSEEYDEALIFHPSDITYNADMLIKICNNSILQGVIPCHKRFMIQNFPAIAGKYKNDKFEDEKTKDGLSIYTINDLTCEFDAELVCDFIGSFYPSSKFQLGCHLECALHFCKIANNIIEEMALFYCFNNIHSPKCSSVFLVNAKPS